MMLPLHHDLKATAATPRSNTTTMNPSIGSSSFMPEAAADVVLSHTDYYEKEQKPLESPHERRRQRQRHVWLSTILLMLVLMMIHQNSAGIEQRRLLKRSLSWNTNNNIPNESIRYLTMYLREDGVVPEDYSPLLSDKTDTIIQDVTTASLCTQSLLKEDHPVYDVILVDDTTQSTTATTSDAYELLLQRLRQRFPQAVMIFLAKKDNTPPLPLLQNVNATLLALKATTPTAVASNLQDVVDAPAILQNPQRQQLGTWGSGDACQFGFSNTGGRLVQHSSLDAENSSQDILQVTTRGGSLAVKNPFGEPRMIYLTYMTTLANSHSNKLYPKVKVEINRQNSVLVDPHHFLGEKMYGTRTTAIGTIPPFSSVKISTISLQAMEEYTCFVEPTIKQK